MRVEKSLSAGASRARKEVEELRREVRRAMRAVESEIPERELYDARRQLGEAGVQSATPAADSSSGSRGGFRDFLDLTPSGGRGRHCRPPLDTRDLGDLRSGEWWLNKLGIGLLLFGVVFLFVYSVERGWIGPWMRVGFGAAIGAALLAVGLRVYERRRAFSQVLLGGGVG